MILLLYPRLSTAGPYLVLRSLAYSVTLIPDGNS